MDLNTRLEYTANAAPMAVLLSHSGAPQTLDDLNTLHQDPLYELINGAKEAYYLKTLSDRLAHRITQSKEVQDLASLVNNSAREMERNWRMAACIANAPRSTGYPFLPTMPSGSAGEAKVSAGSGGLPDSNQSSNAGGSAISGTVPKNSNGSDAQTSANSTVTESQPFVKGQSMDHPITVAGGLFGPARKHRSDLTNFI
jgi:hypothetical protein